MQWDYPNTWLHTVVMTYCPVAGLVTLRCLPHLSGVIGPSPWLLQ